VGVDPQRDARIGMTEAGSYDVHGTPASSKVVA
jgi:hypothetical protein